MELYNPNNADDIVSNEIIMIPVEFVRDIPKVWDVYFVGSHEFIGVVEEINYSYLFTNSFKHQVKCLDIADVREELKKQFVPQRHLIN